MSRQKEEKIKEKGVIMKKTLLRRIAVATTAVAVAAGSTSCGGKKGNSIKVKQKDSKQLMSAAYRAIEIETDIDNVSDIYRLDNDNILITGRSNEDYSTLFYSTDNDFSEFKKWDLSIPTIEHGNVDTQCSVASDGEILVLASFYEYGEDADIYDPELFESEEISEDGEKKEDENKEDTDKSEEEKKESEEASEPATAEASEAEKKEITSENADEDEDEEFDEYDEDDYMDDSKHYSKLYVVDVNGNIKSEKDVEGTDALTYGVGNIVAIGGGKALITAWDEAGEAHYVLNADGTLGEEIKCDEIDYLYGVVAVDTDTLLMYGYAQSAAGMKFIFKDSNTLATKDVDFNFDDASDEFSNAQFYAGSGDYKLYASTSEGFFGIKEDGKSEKLIDWIDSDLGSGSMSTFITMENGDFVAVFNDYYSNNGGSTLYRLSKRDPSELSNVKVLTIASLNGTWELNEKVSAFNKAHDDVRFKVIDYSKYDEYDEETYMLKSSGEDQFKKDIVAGDVPDMLVSYSNGPVMSLANKGLFADMYELIDKDPDLSREDFLPNILKAGEFKGKLVAFSPSFSVSTLAVKKKFTDKENWTVDDLISTYENRANKDMHLMGNDTKDSVLELLYYSLGDCIDYEKGTCSFDDPEFKKLLTFCDGFGASKMFDEDGKISFDDDYSAEMEEYYGSAAYSKEKVLIYQDYLGYTDGLVSLLNGDLAGEDFTLVGYPSNDGKGGIISTEQTYAILSTSENKEYCWELIKGTVTEEVDDENMRYNYGFSSLKKNFDKTLDTCMSKPYYIDPDGKKTEYEYSYYDGTNSVDIKPLTKEQRDFIADYIINSTKAVNDFGSEVENIIQEEAMSYLKGEKTADEIITTLQSRISLILSEQH